MTSHFTCYCFSLNPSLNNSIKQMIEDHQPFLTITFINGVIFVITKWYNSLSIDKVIYFYHLDCALARLKLYFSNDFFFSLHSKSFFDILIAKRNFEHFKSIFLFLMRTIHVSSSLELTVGFLPSVDLMLAFRKPDEGATILISSTSFCSDVGIVSSSVSSLFSLAWASKLNKYCYIINIGQYFYAHHVKTKLSYN